MDPHELRLRILKALLDFEHSGDSRMPEARQLAKSFGVNIQNILDQFDILDTEGAVKVYRGMGDGEGASAMITGLGKKMVEEAQQLSRSKSTTETRLSDNTRRAAQLLEELASDLCAVTFKVSNLVAYLRKYLTVIRLLGWNDEWIVKELNGYSYGEGATPWRLVDNVWYLPQPIADLVSGLRQGSSLPAWETIKSTTGYSEHKVSTSSVKTVLDRVSERLFDDVSRALVSVRFGQAAASVFAKYQDSVSPVLARLGIDDYLEVAYQNLLQDNEASWQNAVMACRNIMYKLSETLWQSPDKSYPYLKAEDGSEKDVTREKVRNRLEAYLHQKGLKRDEMLMRMIAPLFSMASAGKRPVSYEHAQSVLILTYVFVGEMTRLTDMQPVTNLRKI